MLIFTSFDYSGDSIKYAKVALSYFLKKETEVYLNKNGKPIADEAYLSVSHTGKCLAVAVSHVSVGIDIEYIKPRINTIAIAKKYLNVKKEISLSEFYELWTAYESNFKNETINLKPRYFEVFQGCKMAVVSDDKVIAFIPFEILI